MAFSSLVQVSLQLPAARHTSCTGLLEGIQPYCAVSCLWMRHGAHAGILGCATQCF